MVPVTAMNPSHPEAVHGRIAGFGESVAEAEDAALTPLGVGPDFYALEDRLTSVVGVGTDLLYVVVLE